MLQEGGSKPTITLQRDGEGAVLLYPLRPRQAEVTSFPRMGEVSVSLRRHACITHTVSHERRSVGVVRLCDRRAEHVPSELSLAAAYKTSQLR